MGKQTGLYYDNRLIFIGSNTLMFIRAQTSNYYYYLCFFLGGGQKGSRYGGLDCLDLLKQQVNGYFIVYFVEQGCC